MNQGDAALARVEQQERTIAGMNEAHAKLAGLYEAAQAQHSVPDVCDGKEQDAFEGWARKEGLDTSCHPMHWLFLDSKTNSARQGWKAALRYVRAQIAAAPAKAQHSVPDGYRLIRLEHFAAIKAQLDPEQVDAYRGRNIYDEDKVYANWNKCRSALDAIKDVFQQIDWDTENELAELLAAGSSQAKPSTDDGQGGRP